jgi:hypothetical protein
MAPILALGFFVGAGSQWFLQWIVPIAAAKESDCEPSPPHASSDNGGDCSFWVGGWLLLWIGMTILLIILGRLILPHVLFHSDDCSSNGNLDDNELLLLWTTENKNPNVSDTHGPLRMSNQARAKRRRQQRRILRAEMMYTTCSLIGIYASWMYIHWDIPILLRWINLGILIISLLALWVVDRCFPEADGLEEKEISTFRRDAEPRSNWNGYQIMIV